MLCAVGALLLVPVVSVDAMCQETLVITAAASLNCSPTVVPPKEVAMLAVGLVGLEVLALGAVAVLPLPLAENAVLAC
jgi:hypothetical protein